VFECDREASIMRRPWPTTGYCAIKKWQLEVIKLFETVLEREGFLALHLLFAKLGFFRFSIISLLCNIRQISTNRNQGSVFPLTIVSLAKIT
jgi:hypothetical protein